MAGTPVKAYLLLLLLSAFLLLLLLLLLVNYGVQSCAVDPGAVRSSIWKRAGPVMQWVANHLFAPNEDGCRTVVHAATAAWEPATEASSAAASVTEQKPSLRVSSLGLTAFMTVKKFSAALLTNMSPGDGHGSMVCPS